MARDLKPGDIVRTLGGTARVESVESDKPQPVFNLDVAAEPQLLRGQAGLPRLRLQHRSAGCRTF